MGTDSLIRQKPVKHAILLYFSCSSILAGCHWKALSFLQLYISEYRSVPKSNWWALEPSGHVGKLLVTLFEVVIKRSVVEDTAEEHTETVAKEAYEEGAVEVTIKAAEEES